MSGPARFVFGGIIGFLGLLGLWGASQAHSGILYWAGLAVFVAAVAYVMNLVRIACDAWDKPGGH